MYVSGGGYLYGVKAAVEMAQSDAQYKRNEFVRNASLKKSREFLDQDLHKGPHINGSFIVSLKNEIGGLLETLKIFQDKDVNITHIESRRAIRRLSQYELLIECQGPGAGLRMAMQELQGKVKHIELAGENLFVANMESQLKNIPWFPRNIADIDKMSNRVLHYGSELDADHPGFQDQKYRERRKFIGSIADEYKYGHPIPKVEYTGEETATWGIIYSELMKLYPQHACREFLSNIPLLQVYCGYKDDNIPQLEDISKFLKERTGFQLRPVSGYLSARDFLAGLAFRVFHCTQYIRHSSDPFYTPEPDCCHELLGHMPLLADRAFAEFSQEIGLASLGASEDDVAKLSKLYFFTVEFGFCKEGDKNKVYGAGLLSSIAELKHAVSTDSEIKQFSTSDVLDMECRITSFQDAYFVTKSFDEAKKRVRDFASLIKRPYSLHYNPYTQAVEILKTIGDIKTVVRDIQSEMQNLSTALTRLGDKETMCENGV
uniref:Tryptophan 5-hydroxylase 2 n=1 Tax=Meara stichopi TaxID=84115 RepID=A0A2P1DVD4_9BILA|nr:tryptophan hydroxylase [Meara stichopi]